MSPPKAPRNLFFPWFNFVVKKSGKWLEPHTLKFIVPVHLTKPEIREYLRTVYKAKAIKVNTMIKAPNVRQGPSGIYFHSTITQKRAFVRFEDHIPDEIRMMQSSKRPDLHSAITRYMPEHTGRKREDRPDARRKDWLPAHKNIHMELLPTLMRDTEASLPSPQVPIMFDRRLPHKHMASFGPQTMHEDVPEQKHYMVNLAAIREQRDMAARSRSVEERLSDLVIEGNAEEDDD
mmetsp:Transcript_53510/g.122485  ORF Transcript_53510/g.122485 Transcript_53510/m.122485 type:complete len:234 (+) Transcript_53510:28-729(+)